VAAGAIPFTCQGNENGLTIDGGETLGYEIAGALRTAGVTPDRLFIQVGGGALASATAQALRNAVALGVLPRMPRIHAVQTAGCAPLARAWEKVRDRIAAAAGWPADADAIERMRERAAAPLVRDALRHAATHRSEFMWPWESEPASLARGILDDETYDWLAIVAATIASGGWPIVVPEPRIAEAHRLAVERTGIAVSPTGSAGLAGLMELAGRSRVGAGETVAVVFSGR
jgi:threonine synthase